jgi:hypothetical protein
MQELFLMRVQNTCDNNSVEHSLSIKFSYKWDIKLQKENLNCENLATFRRKVESMQASNFFHSFLDEKLKHIVNTCCRHQQPSCYELFFPLCYKKLFKILKNFLLALLMPLPP